MKKYFLSFILMLLFFNNSYSASKIMPENDWTKEDLKGKVKKMTSTTYKYGFSGDGNEERKIITIFNPEGYKIMEYNYYNGRENYILYFKYNEEGLLIESNDYTGTQYIHEYEINEDGNLEETIRTKDKKSDYQTLEKKVYNKEGKKIRERYYTQSMYEKKNIKLSENDTYIRDKKRGLFSLLSDYEYLYDKDGKLKEIKDNMVRSNEKYLVTSYDFEKDGSYFKTTNVPGQRWVTYYDKEGKEVEYVWVTQPSAQMEPVVQLHLIYTTKIDKYKNLTQRIGMRMEEENGKHVEKGIFEKKIVDYEYYE